MEQTRNCGNNGFDMYNIGDRCEYVQYAIEMPMRLWRFLFGKDRLVFSLCETQRNIRIKPVFCEC